MPKNDKTKNIKITKIVFGIVQLVINLFKNKHGKLPETVEDFRDEAQGLKNE